MEAVPPFQIHAMSLHHVQGSHKHPLTFKKRENIAFHHSTGNTKFLQERVELEILLWPFYKNVIWHRGLCSPSADWTELGVQVNRELRIKAGER